MSKKLPNVVLIVAVMTAMCGGSAFAQDALRPTADLKGSDRPLGDPKPIDVFEQSRRTKANLEMWSERVRARLQEADARLKGLNLNEVKTQRLLATEFAEILDDLDEEARTILDSYNKVMSDFALWKEAVGKAPSSFKAVAAEFEKKAAASDEPSLKAHYADFAATSRTLATRYEEKAKKLGDQEFEVQSKLAFVEKSRTFIGDVKIFLSTIPATEEGLEVENFAKRLNSYVKAFQDSVKLLKGLSDQIGAEPAPKPTPTPRPKEAAAVPQPVDGLAGRFRELRRE